ncbi:MAG: MMPL family transporter, partial [Bacillota bacterium]|nr:MMPL family transporter [Bacillota bacterium]
MKFILKHKYVVIAIFVVITVVCAIASAFVKVDYNLMDYLPDESPSTVALNTMKKEYSTGIPNARVMVKNVSVPQALEYKEKLKAVDGVDEVTWLDDAINVYQPLEFAEQKTVEEYYKDKNALFTLTINEDKQQQALKEVRAIIGESGAMSGDAVNTATAINLTTAEINKIMVLLVIVVFAILILTTTSYFDAVIFLITIGAAIFINRGTNLFFGKISFVTNAAG